jgi:hypothetical protein
MDKPFVGSGCVEGPAQCNLQHSCLALRRRGDPRSPSRSADALIGSRRARHARPATREKRVREPIHYCNMPCVACSNEARRGDPHSPSHSADALIGSCRASCAMQATRVNRVREPIQYCNMRALRCMLERAGDGAIHIPLPTVEAH